MCLLAHFVLEIEVEPMIDWKYGCVRFVWWIPFIIGWLLLFYVKGSYLSTIGVIALVMFCILSVLLFGKKSPYQAEKRQRTIKYFSLVFKTILAAATILCLWLFNSNNDNNQLFTLVFPLFLTMVDVVPAFFTKQVTS